MGSDAAFFQKFKDMNYQAIENQVSKERKDRDTEDAADARYFFDNDLRRDRRFIWKNQKSETEVVKKQAKDIAKTWRQILETDEDVAAQWEEKKRQRR